MKSLLAAALVFTASLMAFAQPVDETSAKDIATRFLRGQGKALSAEKLERVSIFPETKASAESPFYIFTSKQAGYAIVAGDKRMRPILAYSLDNTFPKDSDMPPALKAWLSSLQDAVCNLPPAESKDSTQQDNRWQQAAAEAMAPGGKRVELKTAQWNQKHPFNALCPIIDGKRAITGCLPTATAIIVRYYQHPKGVINTYVPPYSVSITKDNVFNGGDWKIDYAWDWNNMPLTDGTDFTEEQTKAVATLMKDIGGLEKASYGNNGTGAAVERVNVLVDSLGYDNGAKFIEWKMFTHDEWLSVLSEEIHQERPILFAGWDYTTGGHAFVADGIDGSANLRMNWGWGGHYNGYYSMDPFAFENEKRYPPYFFTMVAWIGLQPDKGNPKEPIPYVAFLNAKEGLIDPNKPFTIENPYIEFSDKPGIRGRKDVPCDLVMALCDKNGTTKELISEVFNFYSAHVSVPCIITKEIETDDYICVQYRYSNNPWREALHNVSRDRGIIHLKEKTTLEQATSIRITQANDNEKNYELYKNQRIIKISTKLAADIQLYNSVGKTTNYGTIEIDSHNYDYIRDCRLMFSF